jgi:hypothetical protein
MKVAMKPADKPSSEAPPDIPNREVLEIIAARLRSEQIRLGETLEQFQKITARRESISDVLFNLGQLQSTGMSAEEIVPAIKALKKEEEVLELKAKEFQVLITQFGNVQRALAGIERLLNEPTGFSPSGERPVWEGARQVLRQRQQPMSAKEITEQLSALGWRFQGKTPAEAVRTTLIRKKDVFERLERGKFRLKDRPWELSWQPMHSGGGT